MLKHVVISRVRLKTLQYFMYGGEPTGVRSIAQSIEENAHNVHSVLKQLVRSGIIRKEDNIYYPKNIKFLALLRQADEEKG